MNRCERAVLWASCLGALAGAACSSTSSGGGGVFVSVSDTQGDGQLAADATGTTDAGDGVDAEKDAPVLDAALTDVAADVAAVDVVAPDASDALNPVDTVVPADTEVPVDTAVLPDVPANVDVAPVDAAIPSDGAADVGKTPCKSDVACKATNQVCDIADGVCVDCNTKADCTGEQVCQGHACVIVTTCTSSKDCPFVCNKVTGVCVECVTALDCASGKSCGADFACHDKAIACTPGSGQCANSVYHPCLADGTGYDPTGLPCNYGSTCTQGTCTATGCVLPSGMSCNDGDACTTNDVCKNGKCAGSNTGGCNDNNPCTQDICSSPFGCQHVAVSCDDGNACTSDACDKSSGACSSTQLMGTPCEDGNLCTSGETCVFGNCVNGTTINCDDSNACTADSCDATKGCVHDPIPNCPSNACGADPANTCKGKCATDVTCNSMICQLQPTFCPPDWAACCTGP